ncbi:MAG: hypothetical protein GY873_26515 [Bosea sp.]|uniref:hypothetical protein n=1 Tax=Bosea sp. (in: a-proteobacteria) TaxID=1871050 RepID=UPI0023A0EFE5|nr:hypothetical protein [Bosea sp. (in: a-proteobacteria)]MCP4737750.1 hypothetical protein [Bosea sp. (in: a-proteobacteria)]
MKHRSAIEFIPRFDLPLAEIPGVVNEAPAPQTTAIELLPFLAKSAPREPAPDVERIFEDGRQAGRAEAQAAAQIEFARLRAEHAAELERARQAWADQIAGPLAAQVQSALEGIGHQIADTVGRLLRPFLEGELRDAASRALIEQLAPLLRGADNALLRIAGPRELIEALRRVFPPERAVSFEENDAAEVTVLVGETVLETRIGAWTARLRGLGPDRRRRLTNAA